MAKSKKSSQTAKTNKTPQTTQTNKKGGEKAIAPKIAENGPRIAASGNSTNLSTEGANAQQGANTGLLWRLAVLCLALVGFLTLFRGCYNRVAGFLGDYQEFRAWQREYNHGPDDRGKENNGGALEDYIAASLPAKANSEERAAVSRVFQEVADMLDTGKLDTRAAACAETIARLQPEVNPVIWNPFLSALYVRAARECGQNTPSEIAEVWRRIAAAIGKKSRRPAAETLASVVGPAPTAVEVEDNAEGAGGGGADTEAEVTQAESAPPDEPPTADETAADESAEDDTQAQNAGNCPGGNCPTNGTYYNGYGWRWY